jgi:PPK2 family polyphosphate:nucleotide phosphotransferase
VAVSQRTEDRRSSFDTVPEVKGFGVDPGFHGDPSLEKEEAKEELSKLKDRLESLQERLYAEHQRGLLVILQGMDAAGKDSTLKTMAGAMNPLGIQTVPFKAPSAEELAHDFLWRVHKRAPQKGECVFFNRSHYEDVLVVRVDRLAPARVWKRRYEQINAFERLLTENATVIVKFFLHISPGEQRERLQERLEDPTKCWKFSIDDLRKRRQWDAYMRAYKDVLDRCDTKWAPWTVVPADHKWYRNLVVARELVRVLERMNPRYSKPDFDPDKIRIR